MNAPLELISIVIYLFVLIAMSVAFSRMNKNVSDYFRSGCQGTWWLVGSSLLVSGISAFTFTGNGAAAFEAGWSPLAIYIGNVLAFLLLAAFLAGWYRQLRAITDADAVRMRFGPATEQLTIYIMVPMSFFHSSFTLYGLSIFSSAVLGFPVQGVILGLGLVVLLYSTFGGSWAVMATDFVQGLILISVTVLVAILCLQKIGGTGAFFSAVAAEPDFRWFKPEGAFDAAKFTAAWFFVSMIVTLLNQINLRGSNRFFAAKTGREARKAALLGAGLMAFGSLIWFIPPMVARLTMAEEVLALDLNNPAEAAYAVIAREVLPNGMLGLMVIAMFAATMSSLDSGLNRNAAVIVQNVLPPLSRAFGFQLPKDKALMRIGQLATGIFGAMIIALALYFSRQEGFSMFHALLSISVIFGVPITIPMVLGIFIRRVPSYTAIVSWACGAAPSLVAYISANAFDQPWTYQARGFAAIAGGLVGFFATMPFYKYASESHKRRVETFFATMHRPIDFAKEVGAGKDQHQARMIGFASFIVGVIILPLLFLPNPLSGRLCILAVALFCLVVGGALLFSSQRKTSPNPAQSE